MCVAYFTPPCFGKIFRAMFCLLHRAALQAVFPKVASFVEEFHAGKPAGHVGDAPSARPVVKEHHSGSASAATAADKSGAAAGARSSGAASGSGQTIVLKETFYAGAEPRRVAALATARPAA